MGFIICENMIGEKRFYGITFIKIVLGTFRAIFFMGALSLMIWTVYSVFVFITGSPSTHMAFPVIFELQREGIISIGESANFDLLQGKGLIVSDSIPKGFLGIFSILELLMVICVLLIFKLTIRILDSAYLGKFMVVANANRLKNIAFLGMAYFVLENFRTLFSSHYFSDKLESVNVDFTEIHFLSWFSLESLLISLFLLVIAETFRVGALLKKENDLTI